MTCYVLCNHSNIARQLSRTLSLLLCSLPYKVACQQALWGALAAEREKDNLQLRLWNLNICIEKVDAKCWLAEMTLVMKSLPLARVFKVCLHSLSGFRFALIGRNMTAQLTGIQREIRGGIQIPETWLQALLPFPAPLPEHHRELAPSTHTKWVVDG